MKVKLYNCFEHWYHGGTIWIYSDPHFQKDTEMEQYFNWPTAEQRLGYINECVTKNDTLICLGDVGDRLEMISKIKAGYKVLITGNHDKGNQNYKRVKDFLITYVNTQEEAKEVVRSRTYVGGTISNSKKFNIPDKYVDLRIRKCSDNRWGYDYEVLGDNHLFDEIYDGPLFINQKILLSHERIELPFVINIHGHEHTSSFITCKNDAGFNFGVLASDLWCKVLYGHSYCINCAADVIRFKPIRLDKLLKYVPQSCVKSIHEMCIEEATGKKND